MFVQRLAEGTGHDCPQCSTIPLIYLCLVPAPFPSLLTGAEQPGLTAVFASVSPVAQPATIMLSASKHYTAGGG